MDTSEAPGGKKGSKGVALGIQKVSLKAVRGQRTKAQKLRKAKRTEKAEARAEKVVVKSSLSLSHKQKKNSLKTMY
ncbi:hypothetical protein GPECTOR_1g683 [Gonium pectorale]|uniref:Uncharacterized protein n=1 Tax=Gonium pectorale TaxID=33097 RepID=A0A150H4J8_GONPE|nr:hypothetical protein GPECTOR_1g683 [Gonium pectorale]|eukprot:KXZ56758.1 hypothetical protein GPECTOR_1g683 [Gonium pectorale]